MAGTLRSAGSGSGSRRGLDRVGDVSRRDQDVLAIAQVSPAPRPVLRDGECPNCLVTVDGVPGVRSCVTPATDGMRVRRERGWPSVERDALAILDRLHVLLPVGFYYKTFIRPRWAWAVASRMIRRAVGLGRLPDGPVVTRTNRHLRCDLLVVGAGETGRAAASSAAVHGERVVLCDEGDVADRPEGSRSSPATRRSASTRDRWWPSHRWRASCRCTPDGS